MASEAEFNGEVEGTIKSEGEDGKGASTAELEAKVSGEIKIEQAAGRPDGADAAARRVDQLRMLHSVIGETQRQQREIRSAHRTAAPTLEINAAMQGNYRTLQDHGVELDRLTESYARLGRAVHGLEMKAVGQARLGSGMELGKKVWDGGKTVIDMLAKPVKAAGEFQSSVRDVAGKAKVVGNAVKEEEIATSISGAARNNGVGSNELAKGVGQMVDSGVDLDKALAFGPLLAQYSLGQKVSIDDSAKLIGSLNKVPGIQSAGEMKLALGAVAQAGKNGDMNRPQMVQELPALLQGLGKLGLTGQPALLQAIALLKQQTAKDGDPETAGKHLQARLEQLRGGGSDAEKANALAQLKADAPPSALSTAQPDALETDHQQAMGQSAQLWQNLEHAMTDATRKIGDAIRPITDMAAQLATGFANVLGDVAQTFPTVTASVLGIAAAGGALAMGVAGFRTLRGGVEVARGAFASRGRLPAALPAGAEGHGTGVQQVLVTNWPRPERGPGSVEQARAGTTRRTPQSRAGGRAGGDASRRWQSLPGRRGALLAGAVPGGQARAGGFFSRMGGMIQRASPVVGKVLTRSSLAIGGLGLAYNGVQLVRTLTGEGTRRDKASSIGATVSQGIGGLVGGAIAGPVGAVIGAGLAGAAWSKWGANVLNAMPKSLGVGISDKDKDAKPGEAASPPAGGAVPAAGASTAAPAASTAVAASSMAIAGRVSNSIATMPLAAPAVSGAAASSAAGQLAALAAGGTAAVGAAAPRAAPPAAIQQTFNPTISVTVNGDVRDPRRIAEELMPRLRELFALQAEQQQRSALHDIVIN
jgi:hypothetical protein